MVLGAECLEGVGGDPARPLRRRLAGGDVLEVAGHQAFAAHQRLSPPPALKALDFCTATATDAGEPPAPAP